MKVTVLAASLMATSTLAFPFIGNHPARHDGDEVEEEGRGFLGINWPNLAPRPTATARATPVYPPYYPYPTPTPTPVRTGRPPYWYYPTPTPTPTPGGSRPPWRNPDRLIFWHFDDDAGKTFYVYCQPGEVINTRSLGAKGGPFICGKESPKHGGY